MFRRSRPEDFDEYWQQICRELEETPIAPEEQPLAIRSTEFCACHEVRFTSIGPYRLFGYLSIPRGDGPFPAILSGPRYRSAVEPLFQGEANEKRGRFVIFSTAARGQRNADKPFAAQYPGLMTEGMDSPGSYIYRGIVADWLRAADYLLTRPEVDRTRVAAVNRDSLPILTAALRPALTHVVAQPGSFFALQIRRRRNWKTTCGCSRPSKTWLSRRSRFSTRSSLPARCVPELCSGAIQRHSSRSGQPSPGRRTFG